MSKPEISSDVLFWCRFLTRVALLLSLGSPLALASETEASETQPFCDGADPTMRDVKPGSQIGTIDLQLGNVFDVTQSGEDRLLYRVANALHVKTRSDTVLNQLLVQNGDVYKPRLTQESERILRKTPYLYDAELCIQDIVGDKVNLNVITRDVWSLEPSVSFGRKGGKNTSSLGIKERNLLGRGIQTHITTNRDVDRNEIEFGLKKDYLGLSDLAVDLSYGQRSDGDAYRFSLGKPFYALDSLEAWTVTAANENLIDKIYDRGEVVDEYSKSTWDYRASRGFSAGLEGTSVQRFIYGLAFTEARYDAAPGTLNPQVLPQDRKYLYPFVGYQFIQGRFETTRNQESMGRTEDVLLGHRVEFELGFASKSIGSTDNAAIYSVNHEYGHKPTANSRLQLSTELGGRWKEKGLANAFVDFSARYFYQLNPKLLSHAALQLSHGHDLDAANQMYLGGDNGLRGYPLRYQAGKSRALVTLEQRYYTGWYPFRLFRVGAAAFVDVGRTWGDNGFTSERSEWLADAGIGLRLVNTRSAFGKVVHLDIAVPLRTDEATKGVQFLLSTKKHF